MAARISGPLFHHFISSLRKKSLSTARARARFLGENHLKISKSFSREFTMADERPVETAVRAKLTSALKPEHLDVINESSMHNVPPGSESHFKVVIVSQAFEQISRIKKHQLVHQAIQEEIDNSIHALSIVAKTPKEWGESQDVGKSPPCKGGAGL